MARKRRRGAATKSPRYAMKADIVEIHRIFHEREEWLLKLEKTCATQFARIAQIQAELDEIRKAWMKGESPDKP
jgi:hypothetical protein